MPTIGLPKLNKKLRMMEFWSENELTLLKFTMSSVLQQYTYATPWSGGGTSFGCGSTGHSYVKLSDMQVTVNDLPPGIIVSRANPLFRCRSIENDTGSPGSLNGVMLCKMVIEKEADEDYHDAFTFPNGAFPVNANSEQKMQTLIGNVDITNVRENGRYDFCIYNDFIASCVDSGVVIFRDVQTGLRVWFK